MYKYFFLLFASFQAFATCFETDLKPHQEEIEYQTESFQHWEKGYESIGQETFERSFLRKTFPKLAADLISGFDAYKKIETQAVNEFGQEGLFRPGLPGMRGALSFWLEAAGGPPPALRKYRPFLESVPEFLGAVQALSGRGLI